jgi:DNA-binding transcriptional LysR family regulator
MEFQQLKYFIAAAELLNFSRAAERCHVTQPALSRQIAALEQGLGAELFERVRKRVRLSDAGKFFLPKARQLLCDAETAAQQVREMHGGAPRTLRLGFLGIFLDDLVVPVMREFRQRHPAARVSLFELAPRAQLERLRSGELDAAITGNLDERDRDTLKVRRLARYRMAAVLPADHRLAARRSIRLAALAGEDWVSLSEALFPGRRDFLRRCCSPAGFEPRIASEEDTLSMLLGAVAAGAGVGLLPDHASKLPHAGCVFVRLVAPAPAVELLLLRAPVKPSRELETLAELIAERAGALGDD